MADPESTNVADVRDVTENQVAEQNENQQLEVLTYANFDFFKNLLNSKACRLNDHNYR